MNRGLELQLSEQTEMHLLIPRSAFRGKLNRTSRENLTVPEGKTSRTSRENSYLKGNMTVLGVKKYRTSREETPYLEGKKSVVTHLIPFSSIALKSFRVF